MLPEWEGAKQRQAKLITYTIYSYKYNELNQKIFTKWGQKDADTFENACIGFFEKDYACMPGDFDKNKMTIMGEQLSSTNI